MTPMLEFLPEKRATAREMLTHPWLNGILAPSLPLPLPQAPLDEHHPATGSALGTPRDRNDEGQGEGMLVEEKSEVVAITDPERGKVEEGEGGEEPHVAEKDAIEESIKDPRGISSDAPVPSEDSGLEGAGAEAPTPVTMMEI